MTDPSNLKFYIRHRAQVTGPFDAETILEHARSQRITSIHEISLDSTKWQRVQTIEQLRDMIDRLRMPPQPEVTNTGATTEEPHVLHSMDARPTAATHTGSFTGGHSVGAVTGCLCAICGLFTFGLCSPLGVFLSANSLSREKDRGLALWGVLLGTLGTVGWMSLYIHYLVSKPA